jgi:hypothetical protein
VDVVVAVAELDVAKLDVAELDVPELDVAELAVAELVASVCLRIRSRIFMFLFAAAVAVAVVFVDGMSRCEFLRKPAAAGCGWRREDVDLCFLGRVDPRSWKFVLVYLCEVGCACYAVG